MFKDRHLGKFTIFADLIDKSPTAMYQIFASVIPIKTEHDFITNLITYYGISPLYFEEVSPNQVIPEYVFNFTTLEDGQIVMCSCEKVSI